MRAKHYLMIIILSLLGVIQVKGQDDCEEQYKNALELRKKGKGEEANKRLQQVEDMDCNDKLKKFAKNIREAMSADNINLAKTKELTLSYENVRLPYYGGEFPVKVASSSKWKAHVESDWCTIRKEGNTIVIKCEEENTTMQNRIANVIVTSGNKSRTIVVTNEGAPEMLRSSVNSLSFPSNGDTNEVDIYSNTIWKVDSVPHWVTVKNRGKILEFTAEQNKQHVERVGNVVISTPTSSTVIIKVYQGADDEELAFSKNNLTFGPDGGDEFIKVYTNAEVWKFSDFPFWCQVTRISDDSIKIHCTPNEPIDFLREGSVNVTTGFQTLGINISQEAKPYPYMVPKMGIGGRSLSVGINAGMVIPMISTSADSFTGSAVNYTLGNNDESASYKPGVGFTMGIFADIRLYRNIYLIAGINYLQYSYTNEFKSDVNEKIYQTQTYYRAGNTQNKYSEEYTMRQLELPILGSYRYPITKKSHVQINAGPVFNYGLSAKLNVSGFTDSETMRAYNYKGEIAYEDFSVPHSLHYSGEGELDLYDKHAVFCIDEAGRTEEKSKQLEDSPLNRFNVGLRLGCVYEYHGLSIGIDFTYYLLNLARDKFWNGNRWKIFENNDIDAKMTNYQQKNHYLGIKLGYTLRY